MDDIYKRISSDAWQNFWRETWCCYNTKKHRVFGFILNDELKANAIATQLQEAVRLFFRFAVAITALTQKAKRREDAAPTNLLTIRRTECVQRGILRRTSDKDLWVVNPVLTTSNRAQCILQKINRSDGDVCGYASDDASPNFGQETWNSSNEERTAARTRPYPG